MAQVQTILLNLSGSPLDSQLAGRFFLKSGIPRLTSLEKAKLNSSFGFIFKVLIVKNTLFSKSYVPFLYSGSKRASFPQRNF